MIKLVGLIGPIEQKKKLKFVQPFVLHVMLLIHWASYKKIYWLTHFLLFFLVVIGIIDSDI